MSAALAPLITEVIVLDATGLTLDEENSWWDAEIFFKRFRKAVPAKDKPAAAIPAAAKAAPTAQDAADVEIQQKLAEFQALFTPGSSP